ncbi:hypothetical protein HM1_1862 [Heliomicrobium modesticaldum Ice1]|uniref:Uncharacterized protein n=1 Tax=Heliobacterium modesticaldum (strain ATCC 51547 / Ice1) TaxID=498761 RepID=B0TFA4_HELMI|nr:hypothetical protein HM1_1862 [Heliomicrobium modesticaldum Ice1]
MDGRGRAVIEVDASHGSLSSDFQMGAAKKSVCFARCGT